MSKSADEAPVPHAAELTPPRPMLARLVRDLPEGDYLYEPKWDGFRCIAANAGGAVELWSRHGRPLGRYFPEIVTALEQHADSGEWTLDGEVLVTQNDRFDFEALMARLHPSASRVRELAARTPAIYVAFDLIGPSPFAERRTRLEALLRDVPPPLFVTPATTDPAVGRRWLAEFCGGGLDGVVAKARDLPYTPGSRSMLKVKHERTAECVVAGVRGSGEPAEVQSLLLGLYDADGRLEHIGVASSFSRAVRRTLATELFALAAPLAGHPWEHGFLLAGGAMGRLKGAAGRWAPGMTLDWLPLRPERVAEVAYTQVDGYRLRHPGKLVRWRPDRIPDSCRIDQLEVTPPRADAVLAAPSGSLGTRRA